jgi:hypothetical protein
MKLIEVLEPMSAEERRRNINAALTYFGDAGLESAPKGARPPSHVDGGDSGHFPPAIAGRMKQHGISSDHAVHVFEFRDGEPFKVLAVPGRGKKPQTLAMYHLVGLGTYLETGKRDFTDAIARDHCKMYGCYDSPNHASYLDQKHPAFTGDKDSGWMLTVPGIKVAAAIVKEVAEAAEAQ